MLSKEQLEKIANPGPVDIGGAQNPIVTEMATELLSLREQLAELKALEPFGYIDAVHNWNYTNLKSELNTVAFISKTPDGLIRPDYGMALFTAAKPAAGLGVEDITEFMRKAFWRGFESARGTENSNIPEHWKDSKPNLLLALKAKISGA
ncbi:TPA: hypothetical protein PXM64_001051 [Yersinia enterocolitica]|nr:hypothetical protein [Yersinia enterocolitica]